ncbi:SDR family oxidoreductase [Pseudonocardia sp. N23]|uniref:SDR family oxidoreductase n=1 Tax=Pseudonocardia sp. N23 TaxID=1987376 RepID=UPI000BFB52CB|nr:SDR family oxidoreductase [Pseudonocardia sp. N23]GAY09607.1 3-oxoacyl-[acyl-carrier protein] reductase [Pseudonocardia sp. N23]
MGDLCSGRTVLVTGAGRGIGRAHALEFARQGAQVVVNDAGVEVDGTGGTPEVADAVVAEVREAGGAAVASYSDVASSEGADAAVALALDAFGSLDVLVNNAGILRDRMLVNTVDEEWDEVLRVHLRSVFACTRAASRLWRERSKAGEPVDARVISTSSPSGLYGNVGQSGYGAAKAGIAALTVIAATELQRYGVTVNAIAPGARTRMTENLSVLDGVAGPESGFDEMAPDNVAPLVVWLGSTRSAGITGRVFNVWGGRISVAEGWSAGPSADKGARWDAAELGEVVPDLVARAAPNADMWGERPKTP